MIGWYHSVNHWLSRFSARWHRMWPIIFLVGLIVFWTSRFIFPLSVASRNTSLILCTPTRTNTQIKKIVYPWKSNQQPLHVGTRRAIDTKGSGSVSHGISFLLSYNLTHERQNPSYPSSQEVQASFHSGILAHRTSPSPSPCFCFWASQGHGWSLWMSHFFLLGGHRCLPHSHHEISHQCVMYILIVSL